MIDVVIAPSVFLTENAEGWRRTAPPFSFGYRFTQSKLAFVSAVESGSSSHGVLIITSGDAPAATTCG